MSTTQTPPDRRPDPLVPHYVDDDELVALLEHDHDEREADRRAMPSIVIACCVAASRSRSSR
jgi:superfamily II RNA helicase